MPRKTVCSAAHQGLQDLDILRKLLLLHDRAKLLLQQRGQRMQLETDIGKRSD